MSSTAQYKIMVWDPRYDTTRQDTTQQDTKRQGTTRYDTALWNSTKKA